MSTNYSPIQDLIPEIQGRMSNTNSNTNAKRQALVKMMQETGLSTNMTQDPYTDEFGQPLEGLDRLAKILASTGKFNWLNKLFGSRQETKPKRTIRDFITPFKSWDEEQKR